MGTFPNLKSSIFPHPTKFSLVSCNFQRLYYQEECDSRALPITMMYCTLLRLWKDKKAKHHCLHNILPFSIPKYFLWKKLNHKHFVLFLLLSFFYRHIYSLGYVGGQEVASLLLHSPSFASSTLSKVNARRIRQGVHSPGPTLFFPPQNLILRDILGSDFN